MYQSMYEIMGARLLENFKEMKNRAIREFLWKEVIKEES